MPLIENFCSSWEYKAMILYIFTGCFFTTAQLNGLNYIEMFFNSFTNKIFLIVVLYPSFLVMFFYVFQYLNKNNEILLRLGGRYKYAKYILVTMLSMSFFLFFQVIIIVLICCNIVPNEGFILSSNLGYDVYDFIVLIVALIKVFLTITSIGLLNIFLMFKFDRMHIVLIFLMAFLMVLFFGDKIFPMGNLFFQTINPAFHSHGYIYENNILRLIVTGIIYFTLVIIILIRLISISVKDSSLGIRK